MQLVIAEKPMLARDIARAICGIPVKESARLPISGNGFTVCACAGHLLETAEPESINKDWGKPWREDVLPIAHLPWPLVVSKDKESLLSSIGKLLDEAECVFHAGDPDDEGQLIVDEVLDHFNYQGSVYRVLVNDNIEKNIRKAFDQAQDNDSFRALGKAANARRLADFLFGINESRLATLRLHSLVSVGRVQTPTLGLVVTRDEQIENHVCQTYFELDLTGEVDKSGNTATFRFKPSKDLLASEKHLFDVGALDPVIDALSRFDSFVFPTSVKEETKSAPLPYNLTELQSDMSKRFGYSLEETLDATQRLRDKYKAITYNRSDSQYLKEEHFQSAPKTLGVALSNIKESYPLDFSLKSKAFNEEKVSAHHGIIPQEITLDIDSFDEFERNVYIAIVKRYAAQFLPVYRELVSHSEILLEDFGTFEAKCRKPTVLGWREYFAEEKPEKSTKESIWLDEGEHKLSNIAHAISEKTTTPPKPYTEGTLVKDMASIAKYVTDKHIKEILKNKDEGKAGEHGGIGTTATRADIVEKLKSRGFIEERGGKLRSTDKGRAFYHVLPDSIKSADTTAYWWLIQQEIVQGSADASKLSESVISVFNEHVKDAYLGKSLVSPSTIVGICPCCGKQVLARKNSYQCESNQFEKTEKGTFLLAQGCGFSLPRQIAGKKLTSNQVKTLLDKGKSPLIKGFTSKKTGKNFDAYLVLDPKSKKLGFAFANPRSNKTKPRSAKRSLSTRRG